MMREKAVRKIYEERASYNVASLMKSTEVLEIDLMLELPERLAGRLGWWDGLGWWAT